MPNSYPLKSAVNLQLVDAATTPNKLSLAYYSDVPDLPDVLVDTPFRTIDDRGKITHIEEDTDGLDFPEVELTCDVVDSQVETGKHKVEQWINNHKTVGGIDLVSTNDGNAQARKLIDNSLMDIGLKPKYFTLRLEVIFENPATGKTFGRAYNYFQPLEATVSSAEDAQIKLRGRILGTYEEITELS